MAGNQGTPLALRLIDLKRRFYSGSPQGGAPHAVSPVIQTTVELDHYVLTPQYSTTVVQ
ncbi:unnamed protein product, partial [marine sediment metagenome]